MKVRIFKARLDNLYIRYNSCPVNYDKVYNCMEGWCAYSKNTDSYNLRKGIVSDFSEMPSKEISSKEVNRMLSLFQDIFLRIPDVVFFKYAFELERIDYRHFNHALAYPFRSQLFHYAF